MLVLPATRTEFSAAEDRVRLISPAPEAWVEMQRQKLGKLPKRMYKAPQILELHVHFAGNLAPTRCAVSLETQKDHIPNT